MRFAKILPGLVVLLVGIAGCQKTTVEGTAGEKLTLMKPLDQTVKQGENNDVTIRITRKNFNEPVTVRLEQLPEGVLADEKEKTVPADKDSITFTLKADAKARVLVDHKASVSVEAKGMAKATQYFQISVKEKASLKETEKPKP